ncbi:MAG TPA: YggT family protein [Candidatus Deferrimicrobiaceae bacterium]|jgi:YggT family protein
MFIARNFITALAMVLDIALTGYMWIVIARAVLSWVNPDPYNPIVRAISSVTDPVFRFLRRRLPLFAGTIDFTPMVVILAIYFLKYFLVASLRELAFRMP